MRKKDKPFVLYRRGPMAFHIVPRGWQGWAQVAVWIGLLAALIVWFDSRLDPLVPRSDQASAIFLLIAGIVFWLIGGLWWMAVHAEVVDWAMAQRDRQIARRKRRLGVPEERPPHR